MALSDDHTDPETALREAARLGLPADFTHAESDEARAVRGSVVSEIVIVYRIDRDFAGQIV